MSARGNFIELLAAGLPAAVTTALTTFKAWGNTLTVYITTTVGGAGTCTLSLESSHDGTNWFDVVDLDSAASWTIDVNAAGKFEFIIPVGLIPGNEYRLSYACGVAAGTIAIDGISWENPAGSFDLQVGDIHADIGDIEVDTGTLETLVHLEDVAHVTADPGVQALAVRNDTLASLCDTDGDYGPMQVNADGALYSEVVALPGGLTGHAEDDAHTTADVGIEMLAVRNDTLASLCDTDGDYAPVQVDADGAVYTVDETAEALLTTIDSDTSDIKTAVEIIDDIVQEEDTAHTTADAGVMSLAVRNDTLAALCDTDGDYAPVQVDADGALYVVDETIEALLTDIPNVIGTDGAAGPTKAVSVAGTEAGGNMQELLVDSDGHLQIDSLTMPGGLTGHAEDDAHTTADVGVEVLAVRNDTLASLCDTDGDYAPVQVDADGAVYTVDETAEALLTTIDTDTSAIATLVHLEDVAHTTADPGVQMLAVRNDTLAALCDTDGDYAPIQVDADGAVYVVDETIEALLTDIPNVIGTDGAAGPTKAVSIAGTEAGGNLQEILVDATGHPQVDVLTLPGALVGHAEDDAHTTADVGVEILAVRNDTLATLCDTDGDYAPVQVDADGAVYTVDETAEALLTTIDSDTSNIPALGTAAMAASAPATIATDDTQFGAVGAAAAVAGSVHAQLRSIGEAAEAVCVAPLVSPSTGAGAVDIDTAFGAAWELLSITLHLSAAGTTSENFAIVLDANDGAAYDTAIYTLDLSTDSVTDLVLTPDGDELPRFYESGDELNIDWPNTETRTYGIRIVYRLL